MAPKNIDIECPCCQTRLSVDVASAKVLRWSAGAKAQASGPAEDPFERLAAKAKDRDSGTESQLDAAFQKERQRALELDALFEQRKRERGET